MANIITKNLEKKEFRNTWLVSILALLIVSFYTILPDAKTPVMYVFLIMTILSVTIIANFKKISEFATYKVYRPISQKLYGFDQNFIIGLIIGGVVGAGFILLTSLNAFAVISLAVPPLPFSLTGNAFIIKLVAPVVETLFFTIILSLLNLFFPFILSALLVSILFASFHYVVFVLVAGATVSSVFGAFLGAFLYRFTASYLTAHFGAESDAGFHIFVNNYNYNQLYGSLSVVG